MRDRELDAVRTRWLILGIGGGMLVQALIAGTVLAPKPHLSVPLRSKTPAWAVICPSTGEAYGTERLLQCDGCGCWFSALNLTLLSSGFKSRWLCPDCLRPIADETERRHGANGMVVAKP